MTKQTNNAEAASPDETAADSHPEPTASQGGSAEGSLAPQAMSTHDGLEPEDLAVLPGHGKNDSSKRALPALALLTLLSLGVYSFTRSGATPPPSEAPAEAAAQAAPTEASPSPKARARPNATAEQAPETKDTPKAVYGGPMMAPPPAEPEEVDQDTGPNGPSVGRFPDLPPSVVSYLKRMESSEGNAPAAGAESEPASDPVEPPAP